MKKKRTLGTIRLVIRARIRRRRMTRGAARQFKGERGQGAMRSKKEVGSQEGKEKSIRMTK